MSPPQCDAQRVALAVHVMPRLPSIDSRISYGGHVGSVRFYGPIPPTPGLWLGIEWDDPSRGKHDGCKDGVRYFTCSVPGAGSFLRPSANICHGSSFLDALKLKYIEQLHGAQSQETVVLGSSQGTIQVAAVNLDKVRSKLSNLSALREVSLDGVMVAVSDPSGAIRETCPNIRGLDLSKSLIYSWNTVADIATELQHLQSLSLNQNRFQPIHESHKLCGCFNSLTELRLNNTLMTWRNILAVIEFMPKLQDLEIGHNNFTDADLDNDGCYPHRVSLQTVKLNSNGISNWANVCSTLSAFPLLQRVILANNQIGCVHFPEPPHVWLRLQQLSVSFNRLQLWRDISALAAWAPSLNSLTLIGNPIITDCPNNARPLVIARFAALKILDGASITAKERRDAELYYLTYIIGQGPRSDVERCQEHSRWQELCSSVVLSIISNSPPLNRLAEYGRPDDAMSESTPDTLKSRLLELKLYRSLTPVSLDTVQISLKGDEQLIIRALPTMTLKGLRLKIRKAFSCGPKVHVDITMVVNEGTLLPLEEEHDHHDLSWLGIETGSILMCYAHNIT